MRKNGFTLVEAIVVIAILLILGGLLTPIVSSQLQNKKIEVTEEKLKKIKKAIIGDPSVVQFGQRTDFGYVGDVGVLPDWNGNSSVDIVDLYSLVVRPPHVNPWNYDATSGLWSGWRGPYLDPTQYPDGRYESLLDGWGRDFIPEQPSGIAMRIRSYGPDGVSGTCGNDDICIDIFYDEIQAFVQGNTWDECGTGLAFSGIRVYYPRNGTILDYTVNPAGALFFTTCTTATCRTFPIGVRKIMADLNGNGVYGEASANEPNHFIVISNGPAVSLNLKRLGNCTSGSP
jgi:prepilin-type N-terminal cleavage/methylation domain-containing protein